MAEMRIMGTTTGLKELLRTVVPEDQITGGDTKVVWDPTNVDETTNARQMFERLRKKGFNAYAVKGKDGAQGAPITEFDPNAGRIIMAAAMQGGL